MFSNFFSVLIPTFKRDMLIFWRRFPQKFFDSLIFFCSYALIWGYFMPQNWISDDYAPFLMVGTIAGFGFFQIMPKVSILVADLEGQLTLAHFLILPVRSFVIFAYMGFLWGVSSFLLSFFLFPVAKLVLIKQVDLHHVSYLKLLAIFITANLFYGYFSLWIASLVKKISGLDWLRSRLMGPMWILGAYFYTWDSIYHRSPIVAFLNLLNPIVYVMEGIRSAALGSQDYLPFWICMAVLWFCIFLCSIDANRRLRKRLDCI